MTLDEAIDQATSSIIQDMTIQATCHLIDQIIEHAMDEDETYWSSYRGVLVNDKVFYFLENDIEKQISFQIQNNK